MIALAEAASFIRFWFLFLFHGYWVKRVFSWTIFLGFFFWASMISCALKSAPETLERCYVMLCYVQEKKTQDDHSRSLILIWNYQDSVRFVVCYIWNVNYYVKIPNKSTSLTHLQYIHQWIFALLLSQKNFLSQQCLTLGTYINNLQVSTNFLSHKYVHEWFKSLILQ